MPTSSLWFTYSANCLYIVFCFLGNGLEFSATFKFQLAWLAFQTSCWLPLQKIDRKVLIFYFFLLCYCISLCIIHIFWFPSSKMLFQSCFNFQGVCVWNICYMFMFMFLGVETCQELLWKQKSSLQMNFLSYFEPFEVIFFF